MGGGLFNRLDEKADAGAQLAGGALERGQRSVLARWVGDAPMDQLGRALA
jgi:hypothetical protein